jgi:nucleoside-diphosphate-sugar epimerase
VRVVAELQQDRVWLAHHGTGLCNCVHLDRVVMAVRLALKPKQPAGPAFIITDDEAVTWRGFYEAVARELELPVEPHDYDAARPDAGGLILSADTVASHHATWKFPNHRAAQALGLAAVAPFAENIRRSVAWWRFAQGQVAA